MNHGAVSLALAACIATSIAGGSVFAGPPSLSWPVDCKLGQTCFIQNLVDHDPGPGFADFTCGQAGYDGHKGTDIRVPTRRDIAQGVDVLAAAPGRVKAIRDSMPDRVLTEETRAAVAGKECGNGVVLAHGEGWETQYCHMERGSITVAPGDVVGRGQPLGHIGLSGLTEFPHLHLSLRHDGAVIDPFAPDARACTDTPGSPLWSDSIEFSAGALLAGGVSTFLPGMDDVSAGLRVEPDVQQASDALVVWAFFQNLAKGDRISLQLIDPAGRALLGDEAQIMDRDQAETYRARGMKRPESGWERGAYTARIRVRRGENTIIDETRRITVR